MARWPLPRPGHARGAGRRLPGARAAHPGECEAHEGNQLQGKELHFGQGWGTYTESCIQLAKAMATGARFVIGFEPVARPNYPTAPPFVPPVEVEMLPYVPKNKKGTFVGGNWVLWGAAAAGSCTQSYTHQVDTDKYGRMSVKVECPPSAEYYTFPTIVTIYR